MMDWVPALIGRELGYARGISGATFWILPVSIAIITTPISRVISRSRRTIPVAWLGVFAVVAGVAPAVVLGRVEASWFIKILASSFLVVYFQQVKSLDDCRTMLRLAVILTSASGIGQLLGTLGYVEPFIEATSNDRLMTRMFVAGNSANVGFIPLFAAASAGGLLLVAPDKRSDHKAHVLALGLVVFGAYGIAVAAQRSSLIGFVVALALSCTYLLFRSNKRNMVALVMVAMIATGVFVAKRDMVFQIGFSMGYRFQDPVELSNAINFRMAGIAHFGRDLVSKIPLVALGPDELVDATGISPHNVPAEAYYYGGLFLFVTVLSAVVKVIRNVWSTLRKGSSEADRALAATMLILGVASTIHFMGQTGLGLRPLAMVLGLGLSSAWKKSSRVVYDGHSIAEV